MQNVHILKLFLLILPLPFTLETNARSEQTPASLEVVAGRDAKLFCSAGTTNSTGTNQRTTSWLKDGEPVSIDDRIRQSLDDDSLVIRRTAVQDSGIYTCVVSNGRNNATAETLLTVKDVPDHPVARLVRCEGNKAYVSWTEGSPNNAPIAYFTVQYSNSFKEAKETNKMSYLFPNLFGPNDKGVGVKSVDVSSSNRNVTISLPPWTNHTFRVFATNALGKSEPSPTTEACATPPDRPFKNPQNVRIIRNKKNYLVVEWTPMPTTEHNGPGFEYVLTIRNEAQSDHLTQVVIGDWSRSHAEVPVNGTFIPHVIRIVARNHLGESTAPVEEVRGFSGEDVPSVSAPTLEVDPVVSETEVTLYWRWDPKLNTPYIGTPVNGLFRGFWVYYWIRGQKEQGVYMVDIPVDELVPRYEGRQEGTRQSYRYQLTELLGYHDYEAQIMVVNTYYESPPSPTVSFSTIPNVS